MRQDGSTLPRKQLLEFISHSPEQTQKLGQLIGELAEAGDIILLNGKLGAGKTCLVQGIARGLSITEITASPSFVLMRELHGRLPLYHIDLYRLEFVEIDELGLDDYFYGQGLCAIEWAEKGLNLMPLDYLLIEMSYLEQNQRRIRLVPSGKRYQLLLSGLKKALKQTERAGLNVPGDRHLN
jgi:tRNA threonylcarbamoyladenosine biosynthesis protein TsaE